MALKQEKRLRKQARVCYGSPQRKAGGGWQVQMNTRLISIKAAPIYPYIP